MDYIHTGRKLLVTIQTGWLCQPHPSAAAASLHTFIPDSAHKFQVTNLQAIRGYLATDGL